MDSSDEGENIMSQALPIGNLDFNNFDPSAPPASAEDYLKKVMWEAKQCEEIVTVNLKQDQIRKHQPIVKKPNKMSAPLEFVPPREVQKEFLAQFSLLRDKIESCRTTGNIPSPPVRLPREREQEKWCNLCFGSSFQRSILLKQGKTESELPPLVEGTQPLLSILLNISSITLENIIEWHSNWLEVVGFSELQGRWLFSLLACLEKPLTPEMCSLLRGVLKNCALIRASLESVDHPHLIHLNMLITIISRYFGQDDLADP
ncbi:UNVERIFIED_CONTAM: hypothetical protein RMT77_009115 [Armadillidium vulgare]